MTKFEQVYREMVSGVGGVWGSGESIDQTPSTGNDDFYARGDARMPKVIGAKTVKSKKSGKKRSKVPMFKRNFPPTMGL